MNQIKIEIKTIDIFPTQIWTAQLDQLRPHFESWRQIINNMRLEMKPRGNSNRGGWNSPDILAKEPDFKPLMELVSRMLMNILKPMTAKQVDRKISAWANVHDQGGYNTQHLHPGCLLSACFYLSVPEESGELVLIDPRPGVNLSILDGTTPNCRKVHKVKPVEGLLVVFPSWLEHLVEQHNNVEPRISIAMNLS